jgi:translation initiation factor IF-1
MGADQAVSGLVVEILPASLYRVELADRRMVLAHLAPAVRRGFERLRLSDRVRVEVTAGDPMRGRVVAVEPRTGLS